MDAPPRRIYLGRIVKAFGVRGEVKFVGSDDFWPGALASKTLVLQSLHGEVPRARSVSVERFRPHGRHFVLKLEGVDDRDGAEGEVGGELFVDADGLDVALPDRELPFQVIGARVVTEGGEEIGTVVDVVFSAAHPVYEVDTGGRRVLIPAVPEFVVARRRDPPEIAIRVIPGLLDD